MESSLKILISQFKNHQYEVIIYDKTEQRDKLDSKENHGCLVCCLSIFIYFLFVIRYEN